MPSETETDPASLLSTTPEVDEPSSTQSIAQRLMAPLMEKAVEEAKPAAATEETPKPETEENPGDPKPAEADPKPDADAPTEPKAKAKWGELKAKATKADELEKMLAAKEKEMADLRLKAEQVSTVDPTRYETEIAEKQKAIEEYEKKLAVFDIRESKQFENEIRSPLAKIGTDLDRLAASYGVASDPLKDALTLADPKSQRDRLTELMADFDDIHKVKVWNLVEKSQEIFDKAATLQANALEAKKEIDFIKSQEERQQVTEREKKLAAVSEAVQVEMKKAMPMLADEAIAKEVFAAKVDPNDLTKQAFGAYAGVALKHAILDNRAKATRIAELEKELATRSAVSPKAGGGGAQVPPSTAPKVPEGNSLLERARSMGIKVHGQAVS